MLDAPTLAARSPKITPRLQFFVAAVAVAVGVPAAAAPIYETISIEGIVNANGPQTTEPEGNVTLGGVPFDLPDRAGDNIWAGDDFVALLPTMLPVGIAGVEGVHVLANVGNANGSFAPTLRFFGSDGFVHDEELVTGVNIRDWLDPSPLNNPDSVEVFSEQVNGARGRGRAVVDKLFLQLPAEFQTQTLVAIALIDDGNSSNVLLFNGVTAQLVPEPALGLAIAAGPLLLARRRRRA